MRNGGEMTLRRSPRDASVSLHGKEEPPNSRERRNRVKSGGSNRIQISDSFLLKHRLWRYFTKLLVRKPKSSSSEGSKDSTCGSR